jgi:hypothetical protein
MIARSPVVSLITVGSRGSVTGMSKMNFPVSGSPAHAGP